MKNLGKNNAWDDLSLQAVVLFRTTIRECLVSLDELQRAKLIDRLVRASLHMKGNSESREDDFRDEMTKAAAIIAGDTDE